jgi:chromosomal replication initiator protein
VEGDCNRLARAAGMAVASEPAETSFNPLFMYGGVGLGKTHLAHAIGNKTKELHPRKTVLYVSSEKFTNQFIDSLKNNSVNDFLHIYQLIDVLIMDDVQFLSGKERTQDIFFHIFNHLQQNKKQIILTSDRAPNDLAGIEERIISRFKWGLSTDLQKPDYETRTAILRSKMYKDGIELPDEVVEFISHNVDTNIRELEGALISMLARISLDKREPDIDMAKEVLKNFVKRISSEVTIESIQKLVAEYYSVAVDQLKSATRKREITQARQISMYFAKKYTNNSLKSIGSHFGGRDHSTVIHSCTTVKDLIDTDKKIKKEVDELEKKIQVGSM